MLHEIRIYHCIPGRLPALSRLFETVTLRLWDKHGIRQVGFWTTLIGPSNQDLTYLLEWESLAERETRFTAFQEDPEWISSLAEAQREGNLVASFENYIWKPTRYSKLR